MARSAGATRVRKVKGGTRLESLPSELYQELGKRLHSCDYTITTDKTGTVLPVAHVSIRSGGMSFRMTISLNFIDRDAIASFARSVEDGLRTGPAWAQDYSFAYDDTKDIVIIGIGSPGKARYPLDLIVCDDLIDMLYWLAAV